MTSLGARLLRYEQSQAPLVTDLGNAICRSVDEARPGPVYTPSDRQPNGKEDPRSESWHWAQLSHGEMQASHTAHPIACVSFRRRFAPPPGAMPSPSADQLSLHRHHLSLAPPLAAARDDTGPGPQLPSLRHGPISLRPRQAHAPARPNDTGRLSKRSIWMGAVAECATGRRVGPRGVAIAVLCTMNNSNCVQMTG